MTDKKLQRLVYEVVYVDYWHTFLVVATGLDEAEKLARTAFFQADPDRADEAPLQEIRVIGPLDGSV